MLTESRIISHVLELGVATEDGREFNVISFVQICTYAMGTLGQMQYKLKRKNGISTLVSLQTSNPRAAPLVPRVVRT